MVSKEDLKIVEHQLEREINNMQDVVKRCKYGYPQVIQSFPIKEKKPFPTLYWLTCPFLSEEVSKLESYHKIKEVEDMIQNNKELKRQMHELHTKEIEKRLNILGENIKFLPQNIQKKLKETGIGGTKDFSKVKCFHMHYACFLVDEENPIGEMIDHWIGKRNCEEERCKELILRGEN